MRHRRLVDEAGAVDPERGAVGGRAPAWRVDDAPELDVVEREFSAVRVVGLAHGGPLSMSDLRGVFRKLDEATRAAGVDRAGPIFTVLRSDPYVVAPGRRSYFTCVPVRGPVTAPEGLPVEHFAGGLFVVAASAGGLAALERAYGFFFGRFLASRSHELARPEAPEIRLLFPTPPVDVGKDTDLVVEVAVPVSTAMRTDTLLNQR